MKKSRRRRGARNIRQPGRVITLAVITAVLAGILVWMKLAGMRVRVSVEPAEVRVTSQPRVVPAISNAGPSVLPPPVAVATSGVSLLAVAPPPLPPPLVLPAAGPRPVAGEPVPVLASNRLAILRAQIALDRAGFSPGSLDAVLGRQTRLALRAFQARQNLPETGELDALTAGRLQPTGPVFTRRRVVAGELAALQPLGTNWLQKSQQSQLAYETILERVAEEAHCHPDLIEQLNPGVRWAAVTAGDWVVVPMVARPVPTAKAAWIRIRLAARTLDVFDAAGRIIAHYPCSIAQQVEKRPVGALYVTVVAPDPNYTFDPEVFWDSPEARQIGRKLLLAPGPNNPVGTVWLGLSRPGYGIHGTPKPEDVGRTESRGCFRLANWNVEHLLPLVAIGPGGTSVRVEP